MESYLIPDGDGTLIRLWVGPGASRSRVVGPHGDSLKITVSAPPEGGRANRAVIDLLSTLLSADVELVAGETDRRKRVRVALDPATVRLRLFA